MKTGKEDGVVDGVKSSGEVQENQDANVAGVSAEEEVIANLEEGCFCTMFGTETGLEDFKEAVGVEVGLKLRGDGTF